MSEACAVRESFDPQAVRTALDEAGWKPARGQGLAEGLALLVQRSVDLADLERRHEEVRRWLSERVEQVDELRAKFCNEQKARLRVASRFRALQERHAELEAKFCAGWEAEQDRLLARIKELEAGSFRENEALRQIEESARRLGDGYVYSARRHEWCVDRARRARKAWMPCAGCLISHVCRHAYDERNRGLLPQRDCLWSPE